MLCDAAEAVDRLVDAFEDTDVRDDPRPRGLLTGALILPLGITDASAPRT